MKTHAIIPIFVPHAGCPHDCIFCNQKAITAHSAAPTYEETVSIIERNLATIRSNTNITNIEIAFFGGSFTGIPLNEQAQYLKIAKLYKDKGLINHIHLSTRPDYIDRNILDNLKSHDVDIIELGVQSFDPEVLRMSNRGHDPEAVFKSADMIREYDFTLGIQLMVGLPGDSYEKCMYSVQQTIKIAPQIARIYPTVVLRDTGLYEMAKKGVYTPLGQHEAVMTVKDMYRTLTKAGINVIRIGLKSSDNIKMPVKSGKNSDYQHNTHDSGNAGRLTDTPGSHNTGRQNSTHGNHNTDRQNGTHGNHNTGRLNGTPGNHNAGRQNGTPGNHNTGKLNIPDIDNESTVAFGDYHPAFRQLVEAEIAKEDLEAAIPCNLPDGTLLIFKSHPASFSNMIGNCRSNKIYFTDKYPHLKIKFATDKNIEEGIYKVEV